MKRRGGRSGDLSTVKQHPCGHLREPCDQSGDRATAPTLAGVTQLDMTKMVPSRNGIGAKQSVSKIVSNASNSRGM